MTNNKPAKKMQDILSSPKKNLMAEKKQEEDVFAGIPKEKVKLKTAEKSEPEISLKKVAPSQKEERSWQENSLRALWTITAIISMTVNIIVLALLIALYQNYTVLNIPPEIGIDTPKDLLKGLYDNFELMDNAHIKRTIVVKDKIPVEFTLELNQQTNVILSEDVTIDGARVALTTGGLNIFNAPATVILPAGTILPVTLNLNVPVDKTIDITLNVPVDIPLEETDLHQPFTGLQKILKPLYCLISPKATSLGGEAICP